MILIVMSLSYLACTDKLDNNQQVKSIDKGQRKKDLMEANRNLVMQELEAIDEYVNQHNLDMVKTGTGLRYCIEKQGEANLIKAGDVVSLDYEMCFLNDEEVVASSQKDGLMTFIVGRGGVEIGLEEAILYLHKGDVATIIIPSYLAYGLIGDGDKIPPRTTMVYKVKVIENQSNK